MLSNCPHNESGLSNRGLLASFAHAQGRMPDSFLYVIWNDASQTRDRTVEIGIPRLLTR